MQEYVSESITALFSMGVLAGIIISFIIICMCGIIKNHKNESEDNG